MIRDIKAWSLENDRFTISTEQGFETFFFKDLIMCKGADNRTELYFPGEKDPIIIIVSQTLKVWEERLSPEVFWRIQKSYIINRDHILRYYYTDTGIVLLTNECLAYASEANNDRLKAAFRANLICKAKA